MAGTGGGEEAQVRSVQISTIEGKTILGAIGVIVVNICWS
jgi:hypothetical protein